MPIIIIIFGILLYYDYHLYLNQTNIKVVYPYILTIKPTIIDKYQNISINLSNIYNVPLEGNISLILIHPNFITSILLSTSPLSEDHQKNKNKFNLSLDKDGNYTLLLADNLNSKSILRSSFTVESQYITILKFLFGRGLGFFIGVIGPLITILLERGIKIRDNNIQKLEQKSNWLISNGKYYMNVVASGLEIITFFEKQKINAPTISVLSILLIKFYISYLNMKENIGFYYFEGKTEEYFIRKLGEKVVDTIKNQIFSPLNFEDASTKFKKDNLIDNIDFYNKSIFNWLTLENNSVLRYDSDKSKSYIDLDKIKHPVLDFYYDIMLYSNLLHFSIIKGVSISYKNPKKEKVDQYKLLKKHESKLQERINQLNTEICQDSQYYKNKYDFFSQFKPWQVSSFTKIRNFLSLKNDGAVFLLVIITIPILIMWSLIIYIINSNYFIYSSLYWLGMIFLIIVLIMIGFVINTILKR